MNSPETQSRHSVQRLVRPLTALEQKYLGAKVTVLIRLSIDCHIQATITRVDELSNRVYCEIEPGGGWEHYSGWRTIGERVARGIYGETQPTMEFHWPNAELSDRREKNQR